MVELSFKNPSVKLCTEKGWPKLPSAGGYLWPFYIFFFPLVLCTGK